MLSSFLRRHTDTTSTLFVVSHTPLSNRRMRTGLLSHQTSDLVRYSSKLPFAAVVHCCTVIMANNNRPSNGDNSNHRDVVASFVSKLWKIIEKSDYKHFITWSDVSSTV